MVEKVDYLKKELDMPFDEAVSRVERIVAESGFTVMMVKPIHEILKKKLGLKDYPKYTIICACGAPYAKAALDVAKEMGMLFPCSFAVYEDEGKVWVAHVSIMKIGAAIGLAPADEMEPVIKMTGEAVHEAWKRF